MGQGDPGRGWARWLTLVVLLAPYASWGHGGVDLRPPGRHWWPQNVRSVRSYHHLAGDVRLRRLYSHNHFFLCIGGDGRVEGRRQKNGPNNVMEIRSVEIGTVVIRAVRSGFYLAMSRKGRVYGTKKFGLNCHFEERIEENGYNTYASSRWRHEGRPMFLSLNGRGVPRRGPKTRREHLSTHFLPLLPS